MGKSRGRKGGDPVSRKEEGRSRIPFFKREKDRSRDVKGGGDLWCWRKGRV